MKKTLITLVSCLIPILLLAQQQSSKSKSADKLYEKGKAGQNIMLVNAEGINTSAFEFSPTFYQNGLVYVSFHKNGPVDPNTGKPFFELFYAQVNDLSMPQKPQSFSLSINSQVHEGPVSFSRDNNLIYFTRNNMAGGIAKANSKGLVTMKIYEARRGKFDWENIRALPFNNDQYTCFHPTLTADGRRLFFSSDMPGGYGGYDLYYVEKKMDSWTKPINLGSAVNTPGNEVFPFVHESGTLFFSSNGHGGEGGLDIFMAEMTDDGDWGTPVNLGSPFNASTDDLGFIINEEGTKGYFSSDRPGGAGEDDIYMFQSDNSILKNEVPALSTMIVAYDKATNERIAYAGVRVFTQSEDGFAEGDNLYDVQLVPSEAGGELLMKLVRKSEAQLGTPSLVTNLNGEVITYLHRGKKYLVLVTKEGYQGGETSFSTLNLSGSQTIRVPMVRKDCASLNGQVSVQGYNTMVPNANIRVVNLMTGREELLRSSSNGSFSYCLPMGYDFSLVAEKEGYDRGTASISTRNMEGVQPLDVVIKLRSSSEEIVKEPIREGSVIVLENIYYDFNQYIIRRGAARELEALAQLMKQYPSMEVELIAHTDSRGTTEYNLDLSLKRAQAAQNYLIQKGIDESRIKAFGYGESQIRNRCSDGVDCSEEEHQFNRRTEVKIIRIDEPVKVEYQEGNPSDQG